MGNAGQWSAEIAFDIDGEGLERRNIENAASLVRLRRRIEHQAIDAPQERRECFAAAGWREDER